MSLILRVPLANSELLIFQRELFLEKEDPLKFFALFNENKV